MTTLQAIGQWLFVTCSNLLIDAIIFTLIDNVVKRVIDDASGDEKRIVWFGESLLLFAVGLVIYYLYYVPVLLFTLALVTMVYTQFLREVSLREYARSLMTSWEDHLHHTDNVRMIQEHQKVVEESRRRAMILAPPASKPVLQKMSESLFRKSSLAQKANNEKQKAPKLAESGEYKIQNQAQVNSFPATGTKMAPQYSPVLQRPVPPVSLQTQMNHSPSGELSPIRVAKNNWFGKSELKRRPLHGAQRTTDASNSNLIGQTFNIKTKLMSAFGYNSSIDKPAGIRNEGQNLCFINSVLQCFARTPNLPQLLGSARKEEMNCSVAESQLLDSLSDLLMQCSKVKSSMSVLDTTDFRQCASLLMRQGLVASPTDRQHQQDVAEFFTSLTETLHAILNKSVNKGKSPPTSSLSMLKFIYGDLRPENIQQLKEECSKEISEANGLNNDSYAEPIQRLADLEWLTHKQTNQTIVDDKFTGQLVSATHCLLKHHLTVSTQAFNILPVPIVSPRDFSGLVCLEDCFTKYCNVEQLLGKDGIVCSFCSRSNENASTPTVLPGSFVRKNLRSSSQTYQNSHVTGNTDSGMHSPRLPSVSSYMSPIAGVRESLNDSGFQDNVFRTSTPVSQTNFVFPQSLCLRDAERRCLLRQLPECLVIQLMRFTYNHFSQQPRKISASVSIPLKGLDLKSVIFDNVTNRPPLTESEQKYDLYAVCCHLGGESTHSGHYVCYCQSENGAWYKIDDDLVWEVNMEYEIATKEIRDNAYLLFYRRT